MFKFLLFTSLILGSLVQSIDLRAEPKSTPLWLIASHVAKNKEAIEWARGRREAGELIINDLLDVGPTLMGADIRFSDYPDKAIYMHLIDLKPAPPAELRRIGFAEDFEPLARYYIVEKASPFEENRPNVISPYPSVRLIRETADGRVQWLVDRWYEVVSITAHAGPVRGYNVRAKADGPHFNHDAVLLAWAEAPAERPSYFPSVPAPSAASCEDVVAPIKPRNILKRLLGRH